MRFNRAILLAVAVTAAACGCKESSGPAIVKQSREVMGTLAEVTAIGPDEHTARAAVEAAYTRLEDVNRLMSDYRHDSEIGRLNALPAGGSLIVSPETFHVLHQAHRISEATGGVFDVTCRPPVELWKQASRNNRLPDEATLRQALTRVGWRKLGLSPATRTVSKRVDGTQIDLGGIAKGYALDLAASAMKKAGASSGLIDVGGDILAIGRQADGSPWRIGVQHPLQTGLLLKLALTDRAVATSGNQQRFIVIDGKRYSHIIDPRTGQPAEEAVSVTVVAPDGITADAWATVFSVLTVEQGRQRAAKRDDLEAMWTWGTGHEPHVVKTTGFDRYIINSN